MVRSLKEAVVSLLFVATWVVASAASAAQPHSLCVTGEPLVLNGSPDATTNQIIANVCAQPGQADCCATGGRWDLECVQRAANYAIVNGAGDVCGRYNKWEVAIGGTDMTFPRDFNLVTLTGNISGIRDVEGPVATAGRLFGSYFNLNYERQERIGLFAQNGAQLYSGQMFGDTIYQGSLTHNQVTFFDGAASSQPLPIFFGPAQTVLGEMANALAAYDAIAAVKEWSTLHMVGNDPELNVFSVNSADLLTTYDYNIHVPPGAYVIINVFGTNPELKYAGFRGSFSPSRTLWNFPNAATLVMRSLGFSGSVLAPYATADLRDGSLTGTIVAASAYANVELYTAPFHMPSTGGCLAFAPQWSCSNDTKTNEFTHALQVRPEAGFLELSTNNYVAEGVARTSPTHRVWYSFHPAKHYPESAPIAVFFNGGPGSATSQYLFALNTAPRTLDPDRLSPGQSVGTNVGADWTDFANLLYIDAPGTGFSYPVKNPDGTMPSIGTDLDRDAAMFLQVVLRFIWHHPTFANNNVMIVGESYGGVRSVLMLDHLFNYPNLVNPNAAYQDSQLHSELTFYFHNGFGTATPSVAQLAARWNHQVLIQPVVAGSEQVAQGNSRFPYGPNDCMSDTCWVVGPGDDPNLACDPYNCNILNSKALDTDSKVQDRLTSLGTLQAMLGVNPRTIAWMTAGARVNAYGRGGGAAAPEMVAEFGALNADDSYYVMGNSNVLTSYPGARRWSSAGAGELNTVQFLAGLSHGVNTFITSARYDSVVPTIGIPYAIAGFAQTAPVSNWIQGVYYNDTNTSFGLPRAGWMGFPYQPDGSFVVAIAMPQHYEAGHTVSWRAPVELKQDVMKWYLDSLP